MSLSKFDFPYQNNHFLLSCRTCRLPLQLYAVSDPNNFPLSIDYIHFMCGQCLRKWTHCQSCTAFFLFTDQPWNTHFCNGRGTHPMRSARLHYRPFTKSKDRQMMHDLCTVPRVMMFWDDEHILSASEIDDTVEKYDRSTVLNQRGERYVYVIETYLRDELVSIGFISFILRDDTTNGLNQPCLSISVMLAPSFWNLRMATEAVNTLTCTYTRSCIEKNWWDPSSKRLRILVSVAKKNFSSLHLCESVFGLSQWRPNGSIPLRKCEFDPNDQREYQFPASFFKHGHWCANMRDFFEAYFGPAELEAAFLRCQQKSLEIIRCTAFRLSPNKRRGPTCGPLDDLTLQKAKKLLKSDSYTVNWGTNDINSNANHNTIDMSSSTEQLNGESDVFEDLESLHNFFDLFEDPDTDYDQPQSSKIEDSVVGASVSHNTAPTSS